MIACLLALACRLPLGVQDDLAARIDAYVRPYLERGLFSGVVLVADRERVLVERAYGTADFRSGAPMVTDTTFRLASLSKTFTGAAVAHLVQREVIGLRDSLAELLPSFPNARAITVEQLLLHSSGVGEFQEADVYLRTATLDALVERVAAAKPLFAPGERSDYSNEGYVLLAKVVEVASDDSFGDVLQATFFAPLGLRHTRLEGDAPDAGRAWGARAVLGGAPVPLERDEAPLYGASGMTSNARDLLAWMRALRAGQPLDFAALAYPYGWGRRTKDGERWVEQSGMVEGFSTYMASYDSGTFVVCLSNVQSGMQARFGPDFASVLSGGEPSRPPRIAVRGDAGDLSDVAGEYTNPAMGNPLRLRLEEGRLAMTWGPFPFWRPVSAIARDELFVAADDSFLSVRRDEHGHVRGLDLRALAGDGPAPGPATEFTKARADQPVRPK